jgi:MerR-like DNA binding protein/GAF domain-containing protein
MEQLTSRILQRSSDAVVIVRLSDMTIVGVNEALSAVTGHPQHELLGQPNRILLVGLGPTGGSTSAGPLVEVASVTDAPTGLWSSSGALYAGLLSALVVELDGQHHAVCAIREVREPTMAERCMAAREELNRILQGGGPWPLAAARAVERFSRCLQWEFGAIWAADPGSERLRCVAVWKEASDQEALEQASWGAAFAPGEGSLGHTWLIGEPGWLPDAWSDPEFRRSRGGTGGPVHGWLGFPARGTGGVVGVVELISREPKLPSKELLQTIEEFGRLFGQLVEGVQTEDAGRAAASGPGPPATRQVPPRTVSDALRGLAGAVAAMTEALERHPVAASQEPPELVGELAAEVGDLNRVLEGVSDPKADDSPAREPERASDSVPAELPPTLTGLTVKAVSQRTGIPAATLRTWERRYGFVRPLRSPSGYRLYSDDEIVRIQQVKYLLDQGHTIGAAMEAVIRAAGQTRPQPDEDDV